MKLGQVKPRAFGLRDRGRTADRSLKGDCEAMGLSLQAVGALRPAWVMPIQRAVEDEFDASCPC